MFFCIPVNVPSKSNSYRIVGNRLVKTSACKRFEAAFSVYMDNKYKGMGFDSIFEVRIAVYYSNWRSDLDGCNKILLDCLQKFGVIKNDNKCIRIWEEKYVDKSNPRVEMKLITEPKYEPVDPLPKTWR